MLSLSVISIFHAVFGILWVLIAILAFSVAVHMMWEREDRHWSWPFALIEGLVGCLAVFLSYGFFSGW